MRLFAIFVLLAAAFAAETAHIPFYNDAPVELRERLLRVWQELGATEPETAQGIMLSILDAVPEKPAQEDTPLEQFLEIAPQELHAEIRQIWAEDGREEPDFAKIRIQSLLEDSLTKASPKAEVKRPDARSDNPELEKVFDDEHLLLETVLDLAQHPISSAKMQQLVDLLKYSVKTGKHGAFEFILGQVGVQQLMDSEAKSDILAAITAPEAEPAFLGTFIAHPEAMQAQFAQNIGNLLNEENPQLHGAYASGYLSMVPERIQAKLKKLGTDIWTEMQKNVEENRISMTGDNKINF